MKNARPYRQTARAEAAEQTRRDILDAAVELWRQMAWDDVTLASVAERAGVSVQTVIRRFGSKDGLVDACLEEGGSDVARLRDSAPSDDTAAALDVLLAHYEREGDAVLRTLALEDRSDAARRIVEHGRRSHRTWCARVFERDLPRPNSRLYGSRLDAFVAATDVYLWKLLRRDLGRSPTQARAVFETLIDALTRPGESR